MGRYKTFLIFPGILVISIILNSCSRDETLLQKRLRFLDFGTPEEIQRMSSTIKEFEKNHPDIKVKVDYVARGVYQKFLVELAGGAPPDVVYMNDTAYPDLVGRGAFHPLNPFISEDSTFSLDDFRPEALKFCTFDENLYFLPPTSGTIIIYYNRDLFDEAGIPYPEPGWTWEEFREICKKLTVDKNGDGKTDQYALAGWGLLSWLFICVLKSHHTISTVRYRRSGHNANSCTWFYLALRN